MLEKMMVVDFFSSRRRHTRCLSDWSSDVCSSDVWPSSAPSPRSSSRPSPVLIGTLIAVYLLAQRVFWGFDGLVDLSLGLQSVRGSVARCFALIDGLSPTTGDSLPLPATN